MHKHLISDTAKAVWLILSAPSGKFLGRISDVWHSHLERDRSDAV